MNRKKEKKTTKRVQGFPPAPDYSPRELRRSIPDRFAILVECNSEPEQAKLLARLTKEGYSCRSLIV